MAVEIVVFLLQLFAFKDVISYPVAGCDYIFAYIPIEEFALLANAQIEVPALTSSNAMYADGFDIGTALYVDEIVTAYLGGPNSRTSCPKPTSTSCSACSPSSSNGYQPPNQPSVTILPPVAVPSQVQSSSSLLLSTSTLPLSTSTLPLSTSTLPLSTSTLPQTTSTHIDQYSVEETLTEIDSVTSNANLASYGSSLAGVTTGSSRYPAPSYGRRTFSGMVPAYGTVSIYGSGY